MSVTRTLEIQRYLALDEQTMAILRNFDIDWNCGTRFLLGLVKAGFANKDVAESLSDALFNYKILCQQGVSDYERLYYVLSQLFIQLKERGSAVPDDVVAGLCDVATIPTPIKEYLLNG
ncbi:MAG: hypothetical protein R3260_00430 [Pseudomonas sp.]|nr:hypothetical protein [Pseudomonas sp.]